MTGFARTEGAQGSHNWSWEVKSVNGKGLDVRCRMPHGFDALEQERYALIVSNPPYHEGKEQTGYVIERLVRGAPDHLEGDGSLVLVTQRRLRLATLMESTFGTVDVLLDAGPHRVWFGGK